MPNHVRLKRKLARILDREGILNKPVYKEENEVAQKEKQRWQRSKGGREGKGKPGKQGNERAWGFPLNVGKKGTI